MTDELTTTPADPAPPPAGYCRRCGYSLRGLSSGKCPECGGAFDLADRKTFARRPPRARLRRWVWRVAVVAVLVALAAAAVPGWYWWQWRAEQRSLDTIRAVGGRVVVRRVEAEGLGRYVPERWAFLRDRAVNVVLDDLTAEQTGRLDLRPLARVERLVLRHDHVGDPLLAQLRGLTALAEVDLQDNPLDGSGLGHLAGCRGLWHLRLRDTRLTDAGLAAVGRLTSLRHLDLCDTAVTDAGLAHLTGLTRLEQLGLSGTAVTDDGLRHLRGLAALRVVGLHDTSVTEQGRLDLQRALPKVLIDVWIND